MERPTTTLNGDYRALTSRIAATPFSEKSSRGGVGIGVGSLGMTGSF